MARNAGLRDDEYVVTGFVSDDELVALYSDLAPPDRTRSNVCHAAALISISAWAGVL
jgi:hypothetical protein